MITAWRSREVAHQLYSKTEKSTSNWKGISSPERQKRSDHVPEGLPDKFFNEKGEVDLRLVTGEEAVRYFATMGMHIPRIERK